MNLLCVSMEYENVSVERGGRVQTLHDDAIRNATPCPLFISFSFPPCSLLFRTSRSICFYVLFG